MKYCADCRTQYDPELRHSCLETVTVETDSDDLADSRFHVEAREDPLIGTQVGGRYQIISAVGRGGMGTVYKADHSTIGRLVAIKMLHPHLMSEAEALQRFRQEALAVSRVEHAHCVRIFDFGITDVGQPFIVMDYVEGTSLRHLMKQVGLLPLQRAAHIVEQVTEALECAHHAGVVHRDLKPENIMLAQRSGNQDFVSVVDFGISTLVSTRQRVEAYRHRETRGSPPYMSPEQCRFNGEVDHRSDIYSLAIVLYESLSGRLPYNGRNPMEMLDAHVTATPLPLRNARASLAPCEALTATLLKALEKNPNSRQQTIKEFSDDLKDAVRSDLIRLNSLKNRKLQLDGSISQGGPAVDAELAEAHHSRNSDKDPEASYAFVNCPHCGEPVDAGIAFCLACGRTLTTMQDFSKVRAAQGVFTLPRSKDMSTSGVQLNKKSRRGEGSMLNTLNRILSVVCILLIFAIAGAAGGFSLLSLVLSGLFSH